MTEAAPISLEAAHIRAALIKTISNSLAKTAMCAFTYMYVRICAPPTCMCAYALHLHVGMQYSCQDATRNVCIAMTEMSCT